MPPVLISGRIISSNCNIRKYRAGNYPGVVVANWGVVELVVQSAALYTCVLILLLGTYLAGSNVQYIFRDALQPLIVRPSFVFLLLIPNRRFIGLRFHPDHHSRSPSGCNDVVVVRGDRHRQRRIRLEYNAESDSGPSGVPTTTPSYQRLSVTDT